MTTDAQPTTPIPPATTRPRLRSVALPSEHGGWGLTIEPALLGLIVAPSIAGAALGLAALVAFVARTPVKLLLVDRWRRRRLPRTALAERVAIVELVVLAALLGLVALTAHGAFWVPLLIALPLVAVELWFDMRSRSRRLVPELAGTIGVGSVVAAIVLADGGAVALAAGLWFVIAARAVASLPFVRLQLARAKQKAQQTIPSDGAQAAGLALGGAAVALDHRLLAGLVALVVVAVLHIAAARRHPPVAAVLGVQQMILGLVVVMATAVGVLVW
jgi:Ca2+/Na+ antiporter